MRQPGVKSWACSATVHTDARFPSVCTCLWEHVRPLVILMRVQLVFCTNQSNCHKCVLCALCSPRWSCPRQKIITACLWSAAAEGGQRRHQPHFPASEDVTSPRKRRGEGETIAGEMRMLITPPYPARLSNHVRFIIHGTVWAFHTAISNSCVFQ